LEERIVLWNVICNKRIIEKEFGEKLTKNFVKEIKEMELNKRKLMSIPWLQGQVKTLQNYFAQYPPSF
jgi:hypothetical protein